MKILVRIWFITNSLFTFGDLATCYSKSKYNLKLVVLYYRLVSTNYSSNTNQNTKQTNHKVVHFVKIKTHWTGSLKQKHAPTTSCQDKKLVASARKRTRSILRYIGF